jgi:ADP-ribosylglycohydrolase
MRNRDRAIGAYIGAAIGDAMGGPVENNHAARIKRLVGGITGLLPYKKPYRLPNIGQGYALHEDPGSVTDDTFIRADFTRFYLDTEPPRTPQLLVDWMLENTDFFGWWPPLIEALRRVERGEVTAEQGGLTFFQGGGIGWWTPVGILFSGDPDGAAVEVKKLAAIWKAPLEQDFLGVVQGALAEGMRDGATVESMIEAMLALSGPLARQLIERAIDITESAKDLDDLINKLYHNVLMPELEDRFEKEPPRELDGPMPSVIEPLDDTDEKYMSSFFAEQVPLAVAGFLWGRGDPRVSLPATCQFGRDADSTATTVGAWVGAVHGESGLPKEWVNTVCEANAEEIDIRGLADALAAFPESEVR